MMSVHKLSVRLMLLLVGGLMSVQTMTGAEQFVKFQPADGYWQLVAITIGHAPTEHSCIQLAARNLATDFQRVTGSLPSLNDGDGSLSASKILIGTVGTNKQIDAWVKQGLLADLKGKTEKHSMLNSK